MSTAAKIHLSTLERELIQNKEWILTKRSIIEKVCQLFGNVLENYKETVRTEHSLFTKFHKNSSGKISKGENYEGLPYVMMDYPSSFRKENIFAIRTMFWWGNFFSVSLHLSGEHFLIKKDILRWCSYLEEKDFFICINENQWVHTFESSNYIEASKLTDWQSKEISSRNFLKISKKIDLNAWEDIPEFLEKAFTEIIDFIKISFPGDGKDL